MNLHQYGRSLKTAITRHQSTGRLPTKPRVFYAAYTVTRVLNAGTASSDQNATTVRHQPQRGRYNFIDPEVEDKRGGLISQEDRNFIAVAKIGNFKSNLRRRIYSTNSILRPNAYELFAQFSREHKRDLVHINNIDIPLPPPFQRWQNSDAPAPRVKIAQVPVSKRDPVRSETHKKLFETIDTGAKKGPIDWPATFYVVACANREGLLEPRIRSSTVSYLVKRFILENRTDDILRLYVEIQNSWLPLEDREQDALAYLTALVGTLTHRETPSPELVTKVVDVFQLASDKFDSRFTIKTTRGVKAVLAPALLTFLAKNLSLRQSFDVLPDLFRNVNGSGVATDLIVQLYKHLNQNLIKSLDMQPNNLTGTQLIVFYTSQSKIFRLLSLLPRTQALGTKLAKVILDQALTWEEILEAKRLVLECNPDDIIPLQSKFMRAIHRVSQPVQPGTIKARQLVEFLSDMLALTNFRGSSEGKAACVAVGAAIYARMGAFTALERLLTLAEAEVQRKPLILFAPYLREAMKELKTATMNKAPFKRNAVHRAADIGLRLFKLHVRSCEVITAKRGHYIDQKVARDAISLLAYCRHPVNVNETWGMITQNIPPEKLKQSTVAAVIQAFLSWEDPPSALKILSDIYKAQGDSGVTASILSPFITSAICNGWVAKESRLLDHVVKMVIKSSFSWSLLVYYMHQLRHDVEMTKDSSRYRLLYLQVWGEAMQKCKDEAEESRKGVISEETMKQVEMAFGSKLGELLVFT